MFGGWPGLPSSSREGRLVAAPTPRDVVRTDGTASLLRFRAAPGVKPARSLPLLLVPSLINRWYVLDLHEGSSVVEALVGAGIDTYCLDWGCPQDEDRYLTWDDVLARLSRMARAVRRRAGVERIGVLGYCMGGTLSAIHTACEPSHVAALVNLAGPIDFREGGMLAHMTDRRWFDAEAIASAGNMQPRQMQAGFTALRPTNDLRKAVRYADQMVSDPAGFERTALLEGWAADNIPFPAAAYTRYIGDLYQDNQLVRGEHRAGGVRVDLSHITCPLLTIVADRDNICPPAAALALEQHVGSKDIERLSTPGGHVGAVVGATAAQTLYPALVRWLTARLAAREAPAAEASPCATSI